MGKKQKVEVEQPAMPSETPRFSTEFQIALSDQVTREWGGKTRWFYLLLHDFVVPSPGLMIQSDIPGLGYYQVHDVTFDGRVYRCRKAEVGAPTNPEVQARFLLDYGWEERER